MYLLDVPYSDKEEVRRLGAKWNPELKKWFVSDKRYYPLFKKWILKEASQYMVCDHIYIVETEYICPNCRQSTRVVSLGIENYYYLVDYTKVDFIDFMDDYRNEMGVHLCDFTEYVPEPLMRAVCQHYSLKKQYSEMRFSKKHINYYRNCCDHCNKMHETKNLYEKIESPFWISHEEKANRLKLYKVPLQYDFLVDIEIVDLYHEAEPNVVLQYGNFIEIP